MITSVSEWLIFLRGGPPLVGIPLIVGGLALMVFGWRMWKLCVMLSFGLIGAGVAAVLLGHGEEQTFYAVVAGGALAVLGYWSVKYAVSLLGGLIGAAVVGHVLSEMGLCGPSLWIASGTALLACTALAFLNRGRVVIAVTAFLGAVLLISGLTVFVMRMPALYGTIASLGSANAIVVPFILLVPTVMSCFYQAAEVRRTSCDAC